MKKECSRQLLGFVRLSMALPLVLSLGCHDRESSTSTLVFSYGSTDAIKDEVLSDLARQFESQNSGSRVFLHPLPPTTDQQRLFYMNSLGARSVFVDVFESDVIWTAEFASRGLLLDLSEERALSDRSRFLPALVEQASYDGRLLAVPYFATYGGLFYRKDLLEARNLEPPETLEELVDQARTISEAEGISGLLFQAADYEGLACNFLELYAAFGGAPVVENEHIRLEPELTRRTVQFFFDAIHTHHITPEAVLGHTEDESNAAFVSGQAVFMRNWNGASVAIDLEQNSERYGLTTLPTLGGGPMTGGYLLAISRRTQHRDLALQFVEFLVGRQAQQLLAERRNQSPALVEMYEGDRSGLPPLPTAELQRALSRPQSPRYFELSLLLTSELRAVLQGEKSVQEGSSAIVSGAAELQLVRTASPELLGSNFMTRYRP